MKKSHYTPTEIYTQILEILLYSPDGLLYTKLLTKLSISNNQLKNQYLPYLLQIGFIKKRRRTHKPRNVLYKITRNGIESIIYHKIQTLTK